MPSLSDFKIVAEDNNPAFCDTIYLLTEKYEYLLDKNMKVYDFSMIKALSQALGGKIWPNLITDFGQCIEQWRLTGVISESTRHLSEVKMMEWGSFVRIISFNAHDLYLYGGEDPDHVDEDAYYTIKGSTDRLFGDSDKGIPIKIAKIQFTHEKNRADIAWVMDIAVGIDFEMT